MVAVKNPRNLTQVQFYQVCEWLKKQSQPIGLTRGQLCRSASDELKYEVSESAMSKAAKATGVKVIDQRAHNFAGSDRSVRIAKAITVLCEELKKQIGFAVPAEISEAMQNLIDRKTE